MKKDDSAILIALQNEIGQKIELYSGLDFSVSYDFQCAYFLDGNSITKLSLRGLKLKKLPKAVEHLLSVKELYLSNNSLSSVASIKHLKQIEVLDLERNSFSSLNSLKAFFNLKKLYLGSNNVVDLAPLAKLKKLRYCDLKFNQIESIYPLQGLTELTNLILWDNPIKNFETLKNLRQLEELDICETGIKDINILNGLDKLQELDLRNNGLTDIEEVKHLQNLKILHLWGNNLTDISSLSNLRNIEELDINDNQISDISPLENLENLSLLNMSYNDISTFPRWLTSKGLENVYSDDDYQSDSGYNLFNNPIDNVPIEILIQDNDAIEDYFISLEEGAQPINEIKVILLGEGAAGKTSLMKYLQGIPFNKEESQTHGINLAEYIQETGVTLKLWDFGGQDIMHHTHQFFLTQKSVYVLVLNARENSDTEKWLKLIQVFGGDSPIIIVTNKIDENPSEHQNIKYLNTKYENLKNRYLRVSCETGEGLPEFKDLLKNTIKELLHVRTLWGNSWLGVKKDLEAMRNADKLKDYIHFDKYEEICERHGVSKSHRETLITWLHQLGVVTYFADPNLSETNVINPSWLTEGFYSIINAKLVAENFGRFDIKDLPGILDRNRYPKHKYNFLISLMIKFELCYGINNEVFMIPDLLNKEEPDFNFNLKAALKFKIKYTNLLPKAILPKFMVRRNQEIKGDKKWRTGLIIKDGNFESEALIRVDEEDKEITIFVTGLERRGYLASIISNFENISNAYIGLEYEKLVPCNCSVCGTSDKPFYYKYEVLRASKENGRRMYICGISDNDVSIDELLGMLITREELELEIIKLVGKGSFDTKKYIEEENIEQFIKTITSLFSSVSYLLFEKTEKAYHTPLYILLRSIFGSEARADEIQAKGRADIILNLKNLVYIFELKLDGSAQDAIDQIHNNKYYEPYNIEKKKTILMGINFSSKLRNIESYSFEYLK